MQFQPLQSRVGSATSSRVFTNGGQWNVTVQIPSVIYSSARFWIVFESDKTTYPEAEYLTPSYNDTSVVMSVNSNEISQTSNQKITWMLETLDEAGEQVSIHGFQAEFINITRPQNV